jgi:hypothetical protein
MGVTSIQSGSLELTLHRSVLSDDLKGLQDGLRDETSVEILTWNLMQTENSQRYITTLKVHPIYKSRFENKLSFMLNNPPIALCGKPTEQKAPSKDLPSISYMLSNYKHFLTLFFLNIQIEPLPDDTHLWTLQRLDNETIFRFFQSPLINYSSFFPMKSKTQYSLSLIDMVNVSSSLFTTMAIET